MILVTNDDGYYSPLLHKLYNIVDELFDDEITIIAPDTDQSSKSNTVAINEKIIAKKEQQGYHINNTPVACIKYALQKLKLQPHLILSGINLGYNISYEGILCSGTFMAAREGYLNNIRSLAISCSNAKIPSKEILEKVIKDSLNHDFKLANLNIVDERLDQTFLAAESKTILYTPATNMFEIYNLPQYEEGTDADTVLQKRKSSITIME